MPKNAKKIDKKLAKEMAKKLAKKFPIKNCKNFSREEEMLQKVCKKISKCYKMLQIPPIVHKSSKEKKKIKEKNCCKKCAKISKMLQNPPIVLKSL